MSDDIHGTLVIVKDDRRWWETLHDIFELEGYRVYAVERYEAVVSAAQEYQADVVIVAYWLSENEREKTGALVENALRANPATAHIRVLGYGFPRSPSEGAWKPKHYLVAYYTPDDVAAAVAKALADDSW